MGGVGACAAGFVEGSGSVFDTMDKSRKNFAQVSSLWIHAGGIGCPSSAAYSPVCCQPRKTQTSCRRNRKPAVHAPDSSISFADRNQEYENAVFMFKDSPRPISSS